MSLLDTNKGRFCCAQCGSTNILLNHEDCFCLAEAKKDCPIDYVVIGIDPVSGSSFEKNILKGEPKPELQLYERLTREFIPPNWKEYRRPTKEFVS